MFLGSASSEFFPPMSLYAGNFTRHEADPAEGNPSTNIIEEFRLGNKIGIAQSAPSAMLHQEWGRSVKCDQSENGFETEWRDVPDVTE
jgi:hypothetical protein